MDAAVVRGAAEVLGIRNLARVAVAGRVGHVADRAAEGDRVLAHQPADVVVVGCVAGHRRVDGARPELRLDSLPSACVTISDGIEGTKPAVTPMLPNAPGVVRDDDANGPVEQGVLRLDRESTDAAIDECDLAGDGARIGHELRHRQRSDRRSSRRTSRRRRRRQAQDRRTENSNGPQPAVPTGCLTPAIAGGEWMVTAFGGRC